MRLSVLEVVPKSILNKSKGTVKVTSTKVIVSIVYSVLNALPQNLSAKLMGFLDKFMPNKKYYIEKLSDSFYCGSEVGRKEIKKISKKGIKAIVDLKVQSKENVKNLTALCQKYEISYQNIPINLLGRTDEVTDELIKVVKNATSTNPVYVHCKYGEDRTGFARGLYYLLNEDKELPFIIEEMKNKGFKIGLFGHFIDILNEVALSHT